MDETERQYNKRMEKLKVLKAQFVKKYKAIYEEEGLDENYLKAFFEEIKKDLLT